MGAKKAQPLPQPDEENAHDLDIDILDKNQQSQVVLSNLSNLSNPISNNIQSNIQQPQNLDIQLGLGTYELDVKKSNFPAKVDDDADADRVQYSVPAQSFLNLVKRKKSLMNMRSVARNAGDVQRVEHLTMEIAGIDAEMKNVQSQLGVTNVQRFAAQSKNKEGVAYE